MQIRGNLPRTRRLRWPAVATRRTRRHPPGQQPRAACQSERPLPGSAAKSGTTGNCCCTVLVVDMGRRSRACLHPPQSVYVRVPARTKLLPATQPSAHKGWLPKAASCDHSGLLRPRKPLKLPLLMMMRAVSVCVSGRSYHMVPRYSSTELLTHYLTRVGGMQCHCRYICYSQYAAYVLNTQYSSAHPPGCRS